MNKKELIKFSWSKFLAAIIPALGFGLISCYTTVHCAGSSDCPSDYIDIPCVIIAGGIVFLIIWLSLSFIRSFKN